MIFQGLFISILATFGASQFSSMVPEGHVGITYTFGRLNSGIHNPGLFFHLPSPITSVSTVQVTPQTDRIRDVKCGAGDGTLLIFPEVEIGNYLKYEYVYRTVKRFGEDYDNYLVKDKVRAQINVICSGMSSQDIYIDKFDTLDDLLIDYLQAVNDNETESGVVVQFVRMSKPILPRTLQENYDKIANEKTAKKVAEETTKRLAQEHHNEMMTATAEVDRRRAVSEMENQIILSRAKAEAESLFVRKEQEALGNKLLHTPEFMELSRVTSLTNNSKVYFGQIPTSLFISDSKQLSNIGL